MHALLRRFGIKRSDVEILGEPSSHGREVLASESMRPSNASAQWHRRLAEPEVAAKIAGGMADLAVIAAANPEMEALSIAVAHARGARTRQIGGAGDAGSRAGAAGDRGARRAGISPSTIPAATR